jgi:FtsZ-binding cell division protein ZapB
MRSNLTKAYARINELERLCANSEAVPAQPSTDSDSAARARELTASLAAANDACATQQTLRARAEATIADLQRSYSEATERAATLQQKLTAADAQTDRLCRENRSFQQRYDIADNECMQLRTARICAQK